MEPGDPLRYIAIAGRNPSLNVERQPTAPLAGNFESKEPQRLFRGLEGFGWRQGVTKPDASTTPVVV